MRHPRLAPPLAPCHAPHISPCPAPTPPFLLTANFSYVDNAETAPVGQAGRAAALNWILPALFARALIARSSTANRPGQSVNQPQADRQSSHGEKCPWLHARARAARRQD